MGESSVPRGQGSWEKSVRGRLVYEEEVHGWAGFPPVAGVRPMAPIHYPPTHNPFARSLYILRVLTPYLTFVGYLSGKYFPVLQFLFC